MDPSANDSYIYNPVTGKKKNDYNFMQRLWMQLTHIKYMVSWVLKKNTLLKLVLKLM